MTAPMPITDLEEAEAREMLRDGFTPDEVCEWIGCTVEQLPDPGLPFSGRRRGGCMTDALTIEALERVRAAVAGLEPATKAATLRQVIAVAAGQLASVESAEHVEMVFANIGGALRRAAA